MFLIVVSAYLTLLFQFWQSNSHFVVVQALPGYTKNITGQGKRIIPCPSRATELDSQGIGVFVSEIEADSDGTYHSLGVDARI